MMGLALQIVSEMFEECDTALRESVRRRANWWVRDRGERSVLTSLGTVTFTHTRFQHKTTGETAYLLDRAMGLNPHARLSPDARESLLREAARGSYQKAGELSGGEGESLPIWIPK